MATKESVQITVGKNLRRIRKGQGMSVEALANSAGLTYSQISRIELGKINPTAYTLFILSEVLDISPCEFFFETEM